jgi:L-ascorbate metabolism protein UlaG (beta-lactamase superfamily)
VAKITFIGHSAFELTDGIKSVLIDPFITGNPAATASADQFSPQTILLTHAHNDHVGDSLEISKRIGATIIATFELANYLAAKGAKTIGANHGGTVAFDGGTVKFTQAWHTSTYEDGGQVVAPGIPAGLIVRFGGTSIYFAGDTCLFGDMRLIGEEGIDVAVLPIGDHYTMGPADALRAVKFIEPRFVIPCHFNTFPPIQQDGAKFAGDVTRQTKAKAALLAPGESFDIPAAVRGL